MNYRQQYKKETGKDCTENELDCVDDPHYTDEYVAWLETKFSNLEQEFAQALVAHGAKNVEMHFKYKKLVAEELEQLRKKTIKQGVK